MKKLILLIGIMMISISSFGEGHKYYYASYNLNSVTKSLITDDGIKVIPKSYTSLSGGAHYTKIAWENIKTIYGYNLSQKVLDKLMKYDVTVIPINKELSGVNTYVKSYLLIEPYDFINNQVTQFYIAEKYVFKKLHYNEEYVYNTTNYWRHTKGIKGFSLAKRAKIKALSPKEYRDYIEWRRRRANKIMGIGLGTIGAGIGTSFAIPPLGLALSAAGGVTYIVGVFMK